MSVKNCALCWNLQNKDEDSVPLSASQWLKNFILCKKHKQELEEEAKMSAVCACGNQDLTYKNGVSKKTGKKWQGWKCEPCNVMYGMDGIPWGTTKAKPSAPPAPRAVGGTATSPIEKKLDQILQILKENFPSENQVISEEENPF